MLRLVTLLCLATAALGTPFRDNSRLDGRVVGGEPATVKDHPYQLSLQIAGNHQCGAIIISEQWALTAAQCVGGSILGMKLRSGTINREAEDETDGISHEVTYKIVHPDYNPTTRDSDIALLQVYPPFEFGEDSTIAPVNLPKMDTPDLDEGYSTKVSGWGNTRYGGLPANKLQAAQVFIVGTAACQKKYAGLETVSENMICAGDIVDGDVDACQGDTGGPLVKELSSVATRDELVGIVSWGRSCGQANYPGVYTKVSAFVDWIVTQSKSQL